MTLFVGLRWEGYSVASNVPSELSAIGAPTRTLWILLSAVYGVLMIAFGWIVWASAPPNRALRMVGALLMAHTAVGQFWPPLHQRAVLAAGGGTLTDTLHLAWAAVTGIFFMLIVGFGAAAFGTRFRLYSIATMVIGLACGAVTGTYASDVEADLPTPWVGVWERISIATFMAWIVVLAITLLRGPRGAAPSVRATSREKTRALSGDELIEQPVASLHHAITIRRPRHDVRPWLAQMGAGSRAGWYSYDFLDNGRRPSVTRVIPELQQLTVGMIFPAGPGVTDGFTLLAFEPERSLVLGWRAPLRTEREKRSHHRGFRPAERWLSSGSCTSSGALQDLTLLSPGPAQPLYLSREIAGEVSLHHAPGFGVGGQVLLQRGQLPAQGPDWLSRHGINVRRDAAENEARANEFPGMQISKHLSVSRHLHRSAEDEEDRIGERPADNESLPGCKRGPGSDVQNLQDLSMGQVAEREPTHGLLLRRELHRTTLDKEAP